MDRWREVRDRVRDEVLAQGFDSERNTFTQHYDTAEVDASLLMLPLVGFVDGDDPRMLGTIAAIEQDLLHDGPADCATAPRPGSTGSPVRSTRSWRARSGWSRRTPRPAGWTTRTPSSTGSCALANDVGLLAEEFDPVGHRMAGNFPQAFSHLALVEAAFKLREAAG